MRKTFSLLAVLTCAALCLTACLHNDDDDTTYGDMAITAFSLTTVNKYTHTTSSATGNDTVVKTTVTTSGYPMSIDQVGRSIYNQTPLPAGSDVAHVLCSVTSRNGGVVAVKSLTSDSLRYFSTADSIDFTQPRTFRVFALDGSGSRDYIVTLSVATEGDTFTWQQVLQGIDGRLPATDTISLYATPSALRAVYRHNGTWTVARSCDGTAWTADATMDEYKGAAVLGDSLFVLGDGQLLTLWGDDQKTETNAATDAVSLLAAASTGSLYALGTDGGMKASSDGGQTWTDEPLDDSASLLPASAVASVTWTNATTRATDYVLLAGSSDADADHTVIWRKLAPWAGGGQWVYMPVDDAILYPLKRYARLSLARYGQYVVALTTDGTIRQSRDQGITWQTPSALTLPTAVSDVCAAMAGNGDGVLWVVTTTGQVWRGALE